MQFTMPTTSQLVGGLMCHRTPTSWRSASLCAPHDTARPMDGEPWCGSSAEGRRHHRRSPPTTPPMDGPRTSTMRAGHRQQHRTPTVSPHHAGLLHRCTRRSAPPRLVLAGTLPYMPMLAEERGGRATPLELPSFEPLHTMAARRGVPPYYNDATT
jgi:hypothetical protein